MRFCGRTDIGKERAKNQDAFLVLDHFPFHFFGVADGMGGHAAGEVASHMAVTSLRGFIDQHLEGLRTMDLSRENFSTFITNMISEANYRIWKAGQGNRDYQGMGTTITVLAVHGTAYYVGHVGDSRAYRVDREGIYRLTRDHSLVEAMVENGELDKAQVLGHPQRHILTRALGTAPHVEIDFYHGQFLQGDWFLLCTDGLTSYVKEEQIFRAALEAAGEKDLATRLVDMANQGGGQDNITVVVVKTAADQV